jgi:hypothetical protein
MDLVNFSNLTPPDITPLRSTDLYYFAQHPAILNGFFCSVLGIILLFFFLEAVTRRLPQNGEVEKFSDILHHVFVYLTVMLCITSLVIYIIGVEL